MTGVPGRDGPETQPLRFAVLGAGSWGTALAMQLTRVGSRVVLWDWDRDHIEAVGRAGRNERFLPDFPLPPELETESDLETAVRGADDLPAVAADGPFTLAVDLGDDARPVSYRARVVDAGGEVTPASDATIDQIAEAAGLSKPNVIWNRLSLLKKKADMNGRVLPHSSPLKKL